MLVTVPAFLLILAGMAVSATACEGVGGPELTTLTTSLSGEGKEGTTITVLEGSKVKDKATLKGKDASSATGKVTYKVYSESECKTLVKEAGEVTVSGESVPASSEVELEGGTSYYWQAHYSGDSKNGASTSECTEIVTVKAKTSLSTKLSGESKEGEELTVLEGSKAKDKGTLTGTKSSSAGGKVVYKIYSDSKCEHLVDEAGEETVSSGSVPASNEEELEGGKTYYWQAHYGGDSLHQESTSTCSEILNVKAKTKLSTKLSAESKEGEELTILEGVKAKDKATVEGTSSSSAEGKVVYKIYSDSECKDLVAEAGEESVSSGDGAASSEEELEGGKMYYWQAHYSGDGLHEESTSACGAEILKVKTKTTLTTTLSGESKEGEELTILEGAKAKDKATLSGTNSSTAGGKVIYKIYSDKECKTLVKEAGEVTVSSGSVPASSEEELEGGASYYWLASYSGDSLHQAYTSGCEAEVETVKESTSLTTSLSGEGREGAELEVQEEVPVSDAVTLSGKHISKATGTVEYDVYSDGECKTLVAKASTETVTDGSVSASIEETLSQGTYYWQAIYSGDALNQESKGVCGAEILIVKAPTSLTTSLSDGGESGEELGVAEGTAVSDTATLSGSDALLASGTVTYDVYSDPECTKLYVEAGKVSVSGEIVSKSSSETLPPGTYYWQAHYSGDAANFSSNSECGAEITVVEPPLTGVLSGEGNSDEELIVQEGAAVTDSATLQEENFSTATGTVKYDVYSDSECKTLIAEAGEVTVSDGDIPISNAETLSQGTYYWQATYLGDLSHAAAASVCGEEVDIVETPTSVGTSLSGEGESGDDITVKAGAAVTDKASLSGSNAATAGGNLQYDVYSDSECKDLYATASDVEVSSGSVPASEEETLPPGTYYWQAVYSGDGTNHATESSCGSEISVVTTSVTTTISDEEGSGQDIAVPDGMSMDDTATLHGPYAETASGTVKYNVYSDDECKDLVAEAGEVSVSGASAPASSEEKLEPGTYYWQAEYSGDGEMPAAKSICGEEVAQVQPPSYQYAALGDSYSSGEGAGSFYRRTRPSLVNAQNFCHRSRSGWPTLLAENFFGNAAVKSPEIYGRQGRFIFRACSGAETVNIWNAGVGLRNALNGGQYDEWSENEPGVPQTNTWLQTPAQAWWLLTAEAVPKPNPKVGLVTFTIGGNDAGFGAIATNCLVGIFGYNRLNCLATITAQKATFAGIETKVQAILTKIHEWAPKALIRIPAYPQILNPANGAIPVGVIRGDLGRAIGLFKIEAPVAVALGLFTFDLNASVKQAVVKWLDANRGVAANTVSVIAATEQAFNGHRLGDAKSWTNGLVLLPLGITKSFHPNPCGDRSTAALVLQSFGRMVPAGLRCPN